MRFYLMNPISIGLFPAFCRDARNMPDYCELMGVWGRRPQRGPGAEPLAFF